MAETMKSSFFPTFKEKTFYFSFRAEKKTESTNNGMLEKSLKFKPFFFKHLMNKKIYPNYKCDDAEI